MILLYTSFEVLTLGGFHHRDLHNTSLTGEIKNLDALQHLERL